MKDYDTYASSVVDETMKAIDPDLTLLLLGDPGHCEVRPRREYDPRPAHPLTRAKKVVIATQARSDPSCERPGHFTLDSTFSLNASHFSLRSARCSWIRAFNASTPS